MEKYCGEVKTETVVPLHWPLADRLDGAIIKGDELHGKGAARLQFEDGMVEMKVGDFINIPAFKKHRVDWTTPDEPTVWLGVRYE